MVELEEEGLNLFKSWEINKDTIIICLDTARKKRILSQFYDLVVNEHPELLGETLKWYQDTHSNIFADINWF